MTKLTTAVLAAGTGAAAAYFYDAQSGRTRRARIRVQVQRVSNRAEQVIEWVARNLAPRWRGWGMAIRERVDRDRFDDVTLRARVRSRLRRLVNQAAAIDVAVSDGHLTLKGPVLRQEMPDVLARLSVLQGITGINNELDFYEEPSDLPERQGASALSVQGRWPRTWPSRRSDRREFHA